MRLTNFNSFTLLGTISVPNTAVSAENGQCAYIMDEGVQIMRFQPSLSKDNSAPLYPITFIPTPAGYPTSKAGQSHQIELKQSPLTVSELAFDSVLSPKAEWAGPHPQRLISAAWSAQGLRLPNECVIALLTMSGDITIWKSIPIQWVKVVNISNLIYNHLSSENFLKPLKEHNYMENLHENCGALYSTAICWSDRLYEDENGKFSYFINAQKNGHIYFWKISIEEMQKSVTNFEFMQRVQSDLKNITKIQWIHPPGMDPFLVTTNHLGLIESIHLKNGHKSISKIKKSLIWPDADKLLVSHILTIPWASDRTCMIIIKESHFVALLLDAQLKVLKTTFENFGNIKISGIKLIGERRLIIATLTTALFEVNLFSNDLDEITLKYESIDCDLALRGWLLYGLYISQNSVFFVMSCVPCKPLLSTNRKPKAKFVFFHLDSEDFLDKLIKNTSKSLTNHWDYLEVLKLKAAKTPTTTSVWPNEYSNKMSIYETKLCMCLQAMDPKTSMDSIKDLSMCLLYNNVVKSLENYITNLDNLDKFQLNTVAAYIHFLKNYDGPFKKDGSNKLISKIESNNRIPKAEFRCKWCDEEIVVFNCANNHPRQWCTITLQEINEVNCLKCPTCKSLVHPRLLPQIPTCIFCDSYFQYMIFTSRNDVSST